MDDSTQITIRSHNLNGYENSKEFLMEACHSKAFSILGVQEHWLRPSFKKDKGINKLKVLHPDYDAYATSGMSNIVRKGLMRGRPYGGTGFLFHKSLSNCIRARVDIQHERVTVMEMISTPHEILLINAYMPYFMTGNNEAQLAEYCNTLAFIQNIMESHPSHKFILLMDMNCDIFNPTHPYTSLICSMMNDFGLVSSFSLIDNFDSTTEYTRFDLKRNSFTLIDGILISDTLTDLVCSSTIIHPPVNTSDHLPVQLTINLQIDHCDCIKKPVTSYIAWTTLSDSETDLFRDTMSKELHDIAVPFHALNHCSSMCDNYECLLALEIFYQDIVSAVEKADRTLPRRKHGRAKPYWSPELSVLKQKSYDAHKLWKDCDCPRSGPIHIEKMRANYEYKLFLRKSKSITDSAVSDSLSNDLQSKNNGNFWRSWKQLNNSRPSNSSMIDGCIKHNDIADAFAESYKSVYTNSDANESLKSTFEQRFGTYCNNHSSESLQEYLFSWEDMLDAVSNLKTGKASSTFIKTEHILHGCPELLSFIHLLFNALLSHAYMPQEFLCGTISPIIKDPNGDSTKSSNYRPITLDPVFMQMFENALLNKYGKFLICDDLQFAYRRSYSTAHALFVLKSCVDYFTKHGSNVLATFLDCSKAFDTISHYGLFVKLMESGVPVCFLKLIMYWYLNMKSRCRWGEAFSAYFDVLTGTKQGGVLSPRLFTLYVDGLIKRLRNKGVGCHLLSVFVGCLMYADDQ